MDDKSLQAAYDAPSVRVLVTVVDQHGRPLPISRWRSSRQVLDGKPPDWAKSSKRSVMDTGLRDAWVFEKGKTKAIAVPHEWGVEFVFPVLAGLAVEGIVGLTTWAWRRWHKQSGKSTDEAPMVRIQVVRSKDRSGRPRVTQTVEISGAISSQDVSRHVKTALRLQARQS